MNLEESIGLIFEKEPEAIINIFEGDELVALLAKEDWKTDAFKDKRAMCRKYKAPAYFKFIEPLGVPYFFIELEECERREE